MATANAATTTGTFDELLAARAPAVKALMRLLRALLLNIHPDAVEVVRLGDSAASFGVGPKKMSEAYAYLMPRPDYVNLGFYQGAHLPDPAALLEGTGKALRHVKIRTPDDVDQPALHELIRAALAERRAALGLAE